MVGMGADIQASDIGAECTLHITGLGSGVMDGEGGGMLRTGEAIILIMVTRPMPMERIQDTPMDM